MLKKTSLLLLSVFFMGAANANSEIIHLLGGSDVNFEILQVNTQTGIQTGYFHQMGTSTRMRFSGSATRGDATLFDGNHFVASGTFQVNGNRLSVEWRGHGFDEFTIVSRTELRCSLGTWRRM